MFHRILVPLDGTPYSDHALPHAIAIATRTGATIELVHVHQYHEHDPDLIALPQYQFEHIADTEAIRDEYDRAAEEAKLAAMAVEIELRYGVAVRTRLLSGHTVEAIGREAADIVADLIVLTTHARAGVQRLRFGNVAHDLIVNLNVPALCVRPVNDLAPVAAPPIRRVLIPVDGSAFSEQILDVITPLVRAFDAESTLVHVVGARPMFGTGLELVAPGFTNRESAVAYLHELAGRSHDRLSNPELAITEAVDPALSIAQLMSVDDYDLVALATHGRSGLSRLFLGSVAEKVLRYTNKPVLLYRPRAVPLPANELEAAFRIASE